MSVKFLLFGGGGGECRFYFYGRADFSELWLHQSFAKVRMKARACFWYALEPA